MNTVTITIDYEKSLQENLKTITDALRSDPQRMDRAKAYWKKLNAMKDTEFLNTLDPYERELAEYEIETAKKR